MIDLTGPTLEEEVLTKKDEVDEEVSDQEDIEVEDENFNWYIDE